MGISIETIPSRHVISMPGFFFNVIHVLGIKAIPRIHLACGKSLIPCGICRMTRTHGNRPDIARQTITVRAAEPEGMALKASS
jgi:hypothetical protein